MRPLYHCTETGLDSSAYGEGRGTARAVAGGEVGGVGGGAGVKAVFQVFFGDQLEGKALRGSTCFRLRC